MSASSLPPYREEEDPSTLAVLRANKSICGYKTQDSKWKKPVSSPFKEVFKAIEKLGKRVY